MKSLHVAPKQVAYLFRRSIRVRDFRIFLEWYVTIVDFPADLVNEFIPVEGFKQM
jgi:hypothetical protein